MATRFNIIAEQNHGSFIAVYGSNDGYLSHTGAMLYNHYNTPERVDALTNKGGIYSIDESLEKPETIYQNGVTLFYRDYFKERNVDDFFKKEMRHGKKSTTLLWAMHNPHGEHSFIKHFYVYARLNGDNAPRWYHSETPNPNALIPLETALMNEGIIERQKLAA